MKRVTNKMWLLREYNKRVKKEYKVCKMDAKLLQDEARGNAEKNGCEPYIEIPFFMSKNNCTEIIKK